ncbi:MAG: hypothetical protein Q4Q17_01370, partial [Tissierellia bacterium]|nr:hypothetical protein [Tissierellia bacterium]
GKEIYAYALSIGNFVGIWIGEFLGRWMKTKNMMKIHEGLSAEEIYRLQHHPGFEIWIGCILLALIVTFYWSYKQKKIMKKVG